MLFSELRDGDKFYYGSDEKHSTSIWIKLQDKKIDSQNCVSTVGTKGLCYPNDPVVLIERKNMRFNELPIGSRFTSNVGPKGVVWTKIDDDTRGFITNVETDNPEYSGRAFVCRNDEILTLVEEKEMIAEKSVATVLAKDGTMTVVLDGTPYTIHTGHPNYTALRAAVKDKDWSKFESLVDVAQTVAKAFSGAVSAKVEVKGNEVLVDGSPLHNSLTERILTLLNEGFSVDPMVKFLENLVKNPSSRAVSELYDFLDHKNLPITDDGCFLAYKSVGEDWYSKAAGSLKLLQGKANSRGQIFNGIGEVIECPRNSVDDERQHQCSHGLHVGCLDYSGPSGWYHSATDHVLIVKVNPADCVAVPQDHNAQKLRVCKYEVVSEFKGALNKPVYNQNEDYDTDNDYHEYEDEAFEDYMEVDDLEEGDQIRFTYRGEVRTAEVDHLDFDNELVLTKLLNPEDAVGEYRNFKMDEMNNIQFV